MYLGVIDLLFINISCFNWGKRLVNEIVYNIVKYINVKLGIDKLMLLNKIRYFDII